MAEKLVFVCDVCGSSPADPVTFRIDGSTFQKDYCSQHLNELREGARRPRRGRRPGTSAKSPGAGKKTSATRKSTRSRKKTSAARKASRSRKRQGRRASRSTT